jgi:hypothetical protein
MPCLFSPARVSEGKNRRKLRMAVKKKLAVIVHEKSESRLRSENFSTSMHDSSTEAWTKTSIPCSRSCAETRNTGGGATRIHVRLTSGEKRM